MTKEEWSFEREGADLWDQESYDTREEAVDAGKAWAKEEGLKQFVVGKCVDVPIPTELSLEDAFNELDDQYYYNCGNPDADYTPFSESDIGENKLAKKRLEEKLSKAIQEYIDEVGITGRWYNIEDVYTVSMLDTSEEK